ncbi:MAG: MerR family transcriptional regulator [Pseudonocardiaceae bacterium]
MSWPITDVARMSHVTPRTLRHYDDIGLLKPARIGANGYRYYEHEQLLRLQRILLLRELGMGLTAIAKVLDGEDDQLQALRRHHRWLLEERHRLDRLARTVANTITQLEGGTTMPAEELFEGFSFTPETLAHLEAVAVERDGDGVKPYFDEITRRTRDWSPQDYREAQREAADIERRLLALLRAGVSVEDSRVLDILDEDYAGQNRFWTPNRDTYAKLGQAFVDTPELREHLDAQHPRLAEYLRDAMAAYAQARLS